MSMAGYNSASRSYVAVADADGVMRDLSPWVERIGPLGRAVLGLDTTGLNDAAGRTTAGSEATQEFTIAGRWDDASGIGPDAVLAGIVGHAVNVQYGPVTVQTSGDLPTIRPLVEGQPSTEFPLQTVSVPSNVNSYYGPTGNAPGQRRIAGRFVCLSYRVVSKAGEPVRFEATFRQDGAVALGVW